MARARGGTPYPWLGMDLDEVELIVTQGYGRIEIIVTLDYCFLKYGKYK